MKNNLLFGPRNIKKTAFAVGSPILPNHEYLYEAASVPSNINMNVPVGYENAELVSVIVSPEGETYAFNVSFKFRIHFCIGKGRAESEFENQTIFYVMVEMHEKTGKMLYLSNTSDDLEQAMNHYKETLVFYEQDDAIATKRAFHDGLASLKS